MQYLRWTNGSKRSQINSLNAVCRGQDARAPRNGTTCLVGPRRSLAGRCARFPAGCLTCSPLAGIRAGARSCAGGAHSLRGAFARRGRRADLAHRGAVGHRTGGGARGRGDIERPRIRPLDSSLADGWLPGQAVFLAPVDSRGGDCTCRATGLGRRSRRPRAANNTSDEQGIRHAMLAPADSNVGVDEAVFMLSACASFASYLRRKHMAREAPRET